MGGLHPNSKRGQKVKTIQVEITGVAPLLQHKFRTEEHGINKTTAKKKIYDPNEEAEKACFREGKMIVHPTEHLFGALIRAAVSFKFEGKKTYKDIIKRGIIVEPINAPLLDKKGKQYKTWDEIDARRVVIQRSAVVRWRPMYHEGWRIPFSITIIDDESLSPPILKEILEKAGYVGIGDYRPRFGRFQVTKFKVD